MNTTLWNNYSTPEAIVHAIFGLGSMILHFYAIFLCSAIIDYQGNLLRGIVIWTGTAQSVVQKYLESFANKCY